MTLIPLLGILGSAGMMIEPRLREASRERKVDAMVARSAVFLKLATLLSAEQLPTHLRSIGGELGYDPTVVFLLTGISVSSDIPKSRKEIDAFLAAHRSEPLVARVERQLVDLRQETDSNAVDADEMFQRFLELHQLTAKGWEAELSNLRRLGRGSNSELGIRLTAFEVSIDLSTASSDGSRAMYSAIRAKTQAQHDAVRVSLTQARSKADAAYGVLRRFHVPKVDAALDAIGTDDQGLISALTDRYVGGQDLSVRDPADQQRIVSGMKALVRRSNAIDQVAIAAMDESRSTAASVRSDAVRVLVMTIGLSALIVILSGAVAVAFSRRLVRSLAELSTRAARVSDGDIDTKSSVSPGPREVAVVHAAMDELVANLARVRSQALSLAQGAIDDSLLEERLPGALGEYMHLTLGRLAHSIREREELQDRLAEQATRDALTGLPNRAAARFALEQAVARAERHHRTVAVMFVDLDDFKRANDTHGHSFGDDVLVAVSDRLRSAVRAGDLVARLGGDEFMVLAESSGSTEELLELGDRIVKDVSAPIVLSHATVRVGASVGIALTSSTGCAAVDLLRRADIAMYRAKESGRGRVVLFDAELQRITERRQSLEADVARALKNDELSLVYQPVFDLASGQLVSVEALLRWVHPERGPISPAVFVPEIESSPLIVDIGKWVLRRATAELAELRSIPGLEDLRCAVNISGRHLLHSELISDAEGAIRDAGLGSDGLMLEITETAIVSDLATAVEQIRRLRSVGVRLAIDDFGTGYTSIGQLTRLPVNVLKIDRAFIEQLMQPASRRIVELIISVGHALGMVVVAEGIEEEQQREILRELGCDQAQGFLLGTPAPAAALGSLLPVPVLV